MIGRSDIVGASDRVDPGTRSSVGQRNKFDRRRVGRSNPPGRRSVTPPRRAPCGSSLRLAAAASRRGARGRGERPGRGRRLGPERDQQAPPAPPRRSPSGRERPTPTPPGPRHDLAGQQASQQDAQAGRCHEVKPLGASAEVGRRVAVEEQRAGDVEERDRQPLHRQADQAQRQGQAERQQAVIRNPGDDPERQSPPMPGRARVRAAG